MEELIKALDEHLECSNIEINDNQVIFHAYSTKTDASCPYCGLKSSSVHTQYLHHFQDLPIQNRNVLIFLNTRRFRCYCGNENHGLGPWFRRASSDVLKNPR